MHLTGSACVTDAARAAGRPHTLSTMPSDTRTDQLHAPRPRIAHAKARLRSNTTTVQPTMTTDPMHACHPPSPTPSSRPRHSMLSPWPAILATGLVGVVRSIHPPNDCRMRSMQPHQLTLRSARILNASVGASSMKISEIDEQLLVGQLRLERCRRMTCRSTRARSARFCALLVGLVGCWTHWPRSSSRAPHPGPQQLDSAEAASGCGRRSALCVTAGRLRLLEPPT